VDRSEGGEEALSGPGPVCAGERDK
jgi:hypothetical protein